MITDKGTSVGDKSSVTDMLITDDVTVCLRHNHNYARCLRQALPFANSCSSSLLKVMPN